MAWFYDSSIEICNKSYSDDCFIDGVFSSAKNAEVVDRFNVKCDIQPVDTSTVDSDAGILVDAQYKVYMDINNDVFNTSIVIFEGNEYSIAKIIKWNDYMILFIKAVI